MIIRRRLGVAAITVSSAAIALLGVGSGAMASINPATSTGQIKACYETSGSLRPLDHIVATGKCPTGDSSLTWNQTGPRGPAGPQGPAGAQGLTGPQGPAGVSAGLSASSTTGLSLNTGVNNFTPILTTPTATVSGTYYINATIMTYVAQGDGVDCILSAPGLAGIFADVDPVAVSSFQTLPLNQAVPLTAGQSVQVYCGDYTANSGTSFYDGSMTGTLINTATGNVAKPNLATRHPLSPHH